MKISKSVNKLFQYMSQVALFLFWTASISGQQVPAREQQQPVILFGATAHIGNGQVIETSAIKFDKGKIVFVADASVIKIDTVGSDFIDITGKHIYPGLIAPNTQIGLREIDRVRATLDYRDVGRYNPNVRTIIAYNTDSRVSPTVRSNGILLAQVVPSGGVISGTTCVVELDGWNWEDAVHQMDNGIILNWPSYINRTGWWAEPGTTKVNKDYRKQVQAIDDFFNEARAYYNSREHKKVNLKFEAMKGLFKGSSKLFVRTNYVKCIINAIQFATEYRIKLVIVGGRDSHMITDLLKENNISVILTKPHSLPSRKDDDIDLPFRTPYLLQQAGILYCLSGSSSWPQRNLPFYAGTAVAYGLSEEEAIASITYNTAKILGIDGDVGSIEDGKDATLIVSEDDLLDMKTSNITLAYIRGKKIDLDNKQKALYRKFRTKYEEEGHWRETSK